MRAAPFPASISPEMRLCIACCRREPKIGEIGALIERVHWPRLVELARFHRVQGLVWRGLRGLAERIPVEAAQALGADATGIAVGNLRAIAECRSLLNDFAEAGLGLLFLKGQTLGALAYGDSSLKSSIDIDILIDPKDLTDAAELLVSRSYELIVPTGAADEPRLRAWHRRSKESVWLKRSSELQLDLHTGVSDASHLIPELDVHTPVQIVDVGGGIDLPTFATNELFAYLAVHGAWSCWYRLKWIADIAGLLDGRSSDEIHGIYRHSVKAGAGRAAKQTILLSDALFGTLAFAPALRQELMSDRLAQRLCRRALRFLLSDKGEPTARLFGTVPIHWTHFSLLAGPRAKLAEFLRKTKWVAFRATGYSR